MSLSLPPISYPFSMTDIKRRFLSRSNVKCYKLFNFKDTTCFRSRAKERDSMQPLLENSHNPLVQLSTNHLRWVLTQSEFMNHIIATLWTHVSKGWTHGTRATCVAWFPTNGTEAPSSSTNLTSGRESKQALSGTRETLHPAGECIFEWVWIPFNLSGACETLKFAGERIVEWVWIPFTLSGAHETLH